MHVDLGPALAETATPGVPRETLDRLDDRIAAAHETIDAGRRAGEFGYAALDPDPPVGAVEEVASAFPDAETLLVVGIGGSALPAGALADPLLDGPDDLDVRLLDNADPSAFDAALADVDPASTVLNVVSRSGRTAETVANFRAAARAFAGAGVDWTERTVVTTGPEGPLRELAAERGLRTLPAPVDEPGRFGIFSPVGLLPIALGDADLDALVDGAVETASELGPSLFDTPAYAYAAATYALDQRGAGTTVLFPYDDRLLALSEWTAQLFAESLGKDGLGVTPVRARGTTDQHAHLQLYRAGPRDKQVAFLSVADRADEPATVRAGDGEPAGEGAASAAGSAAGPQIEGTAPDYLADTTLGQLQDAARRATAASLVQAERPSVSLRLPALDERSMGGAGLFAMATTVMLGELYGIETFTQPAVEWGKRAARGLLGDPDCTEEAAAAASLPSLVVE